MSSATGTPGPRGRVRGASFPGSSPEIRPALRGVLHAAALPVAAAGTWLLWTASAPTVGSRLTASIFGVTLTALYLVSSSYHLGRFPITVRRVLARLDGAVIQIFIAGTFTPVAFHALDGAWRTWSLLIAWLVAVTGAIIAASPLEAPRWLGTSGYIAVGWLAVVPATRIFLAVPWQGAGLIVLGGVLYTVGAVIYARQRPDPFPQVFGYHEIFHVFVVAASAAHYLAIWRYVLPGG